ncbi:tyrosine/serine/threonine protein phosphatase [Lecanicillium sp. MT-2017a]|nr:tyrosine/serine/threonine protein phosphatase [Lecanicillium sp. MT-2017a]
MPSAAARRIYEDQIPPFMTVFDLDADTIGDCDTVTVVNPKLVDMDPKAAILASAPNNAAIHPDPNHKHHDSTSTQMSESTDSSPTTTLSTTDSSPLTDRSPSSSPDSPVNLIPLNNYPATTFGVVNPTNNNNPGAPAVPSIPETGVALERPMTSPMPRRPRNMKGLSIQPPLAVTTTSKAAAAAAEPSSPSFIKPMIPAMKRKPSQLSLKTNTADLMRPTLEVPPSPAMAPILQRRALKHSTSSPHMLSLLAPTTGQVLPPLPSSRMLERNESGLSEILRPMKTGMRSSFDAAITEEESPIKTQIANRSEYEPYHESVNNEDQKSPSYPEGPVAMYGNDVYLYLEPTAEEASRFDVVINVAREVGNPFDELEQQEAAKAVAPTPIEFSPIPDTALTTDSFTTAFEFQSSEDCQVETPTTPKANPFKKPEYLHIPWDHNTDIAPDLMNLCETIESRTKEGKKVLVHCQQGASRSASLIIAYGLFLKPELSVNDAYYAAQSKSRWISPNMKLMYSLQDFQKEVSAKRITPSSTHRPRTGRSPTKHRLTLSADVTERSAKEPHSAPLPEDEDGSRESKLKDGSKRARGNSSPGIQLVSAGPASAPLTFSWKETDRSASGENSLSKSAPFSFSWGPEPTMLNVPQDVPPRPKSGMGRTESSSGGYAETWLQALQPPPQRPRSSLGVRPLPLRPFQQQDGTESSACKATTVAAPTFSDGEALLSPRVETMTTNPLHEVSGFAGMRFVQSPPTPTADLFSPRATSFTPDPFSVFGQPAPTVDPRSPPTKGEVPITRSIDDIL